MSGDLAYLLNAAETGGVRNAKEIPEDDEFVDANREKRRKASKEMYSVCWRGTLREQRECVKRRE